MKENKPFPVPEIFEAVSRNFPKKGEPQKLRNKYDSVSQKHEAYFPNLRYNPNVCISDILSWPNVLTQKTGSSIHQTLMDPMQRVFHVSNRFIHTICCFVDAVINTIAGCIKAVSIRCFSSLLSTFGHYSLISIWMSKLVLPIKDHDSMSQTGRNLQKRRIVSLKPPSHPCGNNCYMLLEIYGRDAPMFSTSSDFSSFLRTVESEWSGSDQSLFRVLQEVLRNDICAITKGLANKTCQQVK